MAVVGTDNEIFLARVKSIAMPDYRKPQPAKASGSSLAHSSSTHPYWVRLGLAPSSKYAAFSFET